MPFSPGDATRFKKDISPGSKERWASIVNQVLKETNDEGRAIRTANGATRSALSRRMKKTYGQ